MPAKILLSLYLASCLAIGVGCTKLPSNGPVEPVRPVPVVIKSESEIWSEIAERIDRGKVADTDEILRIVRESVALGDLASDAPVKDLEAKNVVITDANKAEYSAKLRGIK